MPRNLIKRPLKQGHEAYELFLKILLLKPKTYFRFVLLPPADGCGRAFACFPSREECGGERGIVLSHYPQGSVTFYLREGLFFISHNIVLLSHLGV